VLTVLLYSIEWFAEADNLLRNEDALWDETRFTTYGKWMDGWESRRRRSSGHDWCIIRLGIPGNIVGMDIDTAHFTGNYPPHASVQAACLDESSVCVARAGRGSRLTALRRQCLINLRKCARAPEPQGQTVGWGCARATRNLLWSTLRAQRQVHFV
jgi:allantoicase